MKQTAVEWLINELQKTRDWQRVLNEANQSSTSVRDVIAEAKEMEKEQMIDLVYQIKHYSHFPEYAKHTLDELVNEYCNETYGGNK